MNKRREERKTGDCYRITFGKHQQQCRCVATGRCKIVMPSCHSPVGQQPHRKQHTSPAVVALGKEYQLNFQ